MTKESITKSEVLVQAPSQAGPLKLQAEAFGKEGMAGSKAGSMLSKTIDVPNCAALSVPPNKIEPVQNFL